MSIIKELRIQRGLSQRKLAEICGVHQTAVSQWEIGRTSPDTESLTRLAACLGVSVDALLGNVNREVPVLGTVRAGLPIDAYEEILDYESLAPDMTVRGEYFGLRITGDSMAPRICEGDVVIVRRQPDVESGETAVVLINGNDATIKKAIKKDTSLMLVPLNSSYEPMIFTSEEIASLPVTIIGKVVELRAKF